MASPVCLLLLAGCLGSVVQGAALPTENLLDFLQAALENPEQLMTALGAQRVKREVDFDREFKLPFNIAFGLKHTDKSNPYFGGGKSYIKFPLKKFYPQSDIEFVDLRLYYGPPGEIVLDYTLTHADGDGDETGSFKISRTITNGVWRTSISVSDDNDFSHRLIPLFKLTGESDLGTVFKGDYAGTFGKINIQVDRTPDKQIDVRVDFNGKIYTLKGVKYANTVTVDVDADGRQYSLKGTLSKVPQEWVITVVGDAAGDVDVLMKISNDYKTGKMIAKHNNINYLQLDLEGRVKKMNLRGKESKKYLAQGQFSVLGGTISTGQYRLKMEDGTMKVKISPKHKKSIDLMYYYKPTYQNELFTGASWGYEAGRSGKVLLKYVALLNHINNDQKYDSNMNSTLTVENESEMYGLFCKLGSYIGEGCFNKRESHVEIFFDKVNKNMMFNKFAVDMNNRKDGVSFLEVKANTLQQPYNFRIFSPLLLADDIGNELTITANHKPGSELTLETNIEDGKLNIKHHDNASGGKALRAEISKFGESYILYTLESLYYNDKKQLEMGFSSQLDINQKSLLYPFFCTYGSGCFMSRKAEFGILVDLINKNGLLHRFNIHGVVEKDGEKVLDLEISSSDRCQQSFHTCPFIPNQTPYKVFLNAPYLLPEVIQQPTLDIKLQPGLGQSLDITTNLPGYQTFRVETVSGNKRDFYLNGKLLASGGYQELDKSYMQEFNMLDGRKYVGTANWQRKGDLSKNQATIAVDGPDRNLDGELDWNLSNIQDADMTVDLKGENPIVGKYKFSRTTEWKVSEGAFKAMSAGSSSSEKGWFAERGLSPIDTDMDVEFNREKWILNGKLSKTVAGKKYSIDVQDNVFDVGY